VTRFVEIPDRTDGAYDSVDADKVVAVHAATVPQGATCDVGALDVTLSFESGHDRVYRFRTPMAGTKFITAIERGRELVQTPTEPVGADLSTSVGVAGR
jgi:hypothetical protein